MSEIIATTKVRIEADTTGLKEQATKEVNAAVPEFKEVKISADAQALIGAANTAKDRLADTRRELADIQKKLRELGEARRQAETAGGPLLEAFQRQQEAFAKDPDPTKDEGPLRKRAELLSAQVFLEEQAAASAKRRALDQLAADEAAVIGANEATAARTREAAAADKAAVAEKKASGVGGFLRAGTAGRSSGIAGLLGAGLRLGVVGAAATAAFQAVGELQQALRVTGNEAFTAQGKLRNFGAELLGANVIGAFKALAAERKATFEGDLGSRLEAELKRMKEATDPLIVTEEKLAAARQKSKDGGNDYIKVLFALGRINIEQAVALAAVDKRLAEQEKIVDSVADAWGNYSAAVEKAGSELKAFGPDTRGGPRGPGGLPQPGTTNVPPGTVIGQQRTGIPAPILAPDRSVFRAGTGGPDVANQIRESITSRIKDEEERLRLTVRDKTIVQKQARAAFETAKEAKLANSNADDAADEYLALVLATTGVANATAAAAAAAAAATDEAQNLANSVANAQVAAIADPAKQATAALAQARVEEAQASAKVTKAIKESGKNSKEANEATAAYQIAVAAREGIENSIAFSAQQAAKAAAESVAASRKAGTEQGLENAITAAALTKRTSDDKKAFDAAIRYWVALRNRATDVEARESARAKVISLFQGRAAALAGGANVDVTAAKLANDLAFAQLKKLDTRPFLRALIAFAKQAMDTAVKGTAAFELARGTWIQAKANFNANAQVLDDLKKANARAKAALTDSTADDERLIRADIAYWKRRVAQTKGMGVIHQEAIREELRAEAELKGLVDEIKPTTTVFDLLTESTRAFTEHAGNLINASNRFSADSFTGGIRGQIGSTPNAAGRARLGLEGNAAATDRNTTALDRLTIAIKGMEPKGHPPAAGATTITGGKVKLGAWGNSGWAAWSQRAGVT